MEGAKSVITGQFPIRKRQGKRTYEKRLNTYIRIKNRGGFLILKSKN